MLRPCKSTGPIENLKRPMAAVVLQGKPSRGGKLAPYLGATNTKQVEDTFRDRYTSENDGSERRRPGARLGA